MQAANYAPIYAACLYPELSEFMRTKGWALAVHGSLARDFDLVAIPWQPAPVAPALCVEGICHYWAFKMVGDPETRLHGRLIYTIALKFGECFLDLSFMPAKVGAGETAADSERLEWLMRNVSGKEFRRLGVTYGGNCGRDRIDAAMNPHNRVT